MSDELRGYDAWKTTPPEGHRQECAVCDGEGRVLTDEFRAKLVEILDSGASEYAVAQFIWTFDHATDECGECGGEGCIDPPTPEDIAERRADEQLSDPDFNRSTGRYD